MLRWEKEVFEMSTWLLSVLFGVVLTITLVVGLTIWLFNSLKPQDTEKEKVTGGTATDKPKEGFILQWGRRAWELIQHPSVYVALAVVALNWLVWAYNDEFWLALWSNQGRFWAINITLWFASSILFFVKPEYRPIARRFSIGIYALLVLILISEGWSMHQRGDLAPDEWEKKEKVEKAQKATAEKLPAVLLAIMECNPGAPEFRPPTEAGGEVPA